jgi:hypothetical protein
LFPGIEQKERSGYLTLLWHHEKHQATWAILAKAFTIVRDLSRNAGEAEPKLKSFLAINTTFAGVPPLPIDMNPGDALAALLSSPPVSVSVSVEDIVANSLCHGFLKRVIPAHVKDKPCIVMSTLPDINSQSEAMLPKEKTLQENPAHIAPAVDHVYTYPISGAQDQYIGDPASRGANHVYEALSEIL